jgi:hypothetical protein
MIHPLGTLHERWRFWLAHRAVMAASPVGLAGLEGKVAAGEVVMAGGCKAAHKVWTLVHAYGRGDALTMVHRGVLGPVAAAVAGPRRQWRAFHITKSGRSVAALANSQARIDAARVLADSRVCAVEPTLGRGAAEMAGACGQQRAVRRCQQQPPRTALLGSTKTCSAGQPWWRRLWGRRSRAAGGAAAASVPPAIQMSYVTWLDMGQ